VGSSFDLNAPLVGAGLGVGVVMGMLVVTVVTVAGFTLGSVV